MAGNKESAKRGTDTQKAQARERQRVVDNNALGKNPRNPGVPSEAWARKRGLIKDDND